MTLAFYIAVIAFVATGLGCIAQQGRDWAKPARRYFIGLLPVLAMTIVALGFEIGPVKMAVPVMWGVCAITNVVEYIVAAWRRPSMDLAMPEMLLQAVAAPALFIIWLGLVGGELLSPNHEKRWPQAR